MAYKQIRRRMKHEVAEKEGATPHVSDTFEVSQIQTDRELMTADDALALQDVIGNRAVNHLTGATPATTSARTGYVQPKPLIAQPMRRVSSSEPAYANLRRKLGIQRASGDGSFDTNADFESQVNQQSGGGQPLPSDVRADLEPKFGADFSGVKVHTDAKAAQLSQDVGAQAFTHGSDIYFNQGKYNPESSSGKHLLAHELTHTVQQTGGAAVQRLSNTQPHIQRYVYQPIIDQFSAGDLLYGLSGPRQETVIPIQHKMTSIGAQVTNGENVQATGGNIQQAAQTLDELNNVFVGTDRTDPNAKSTKGYGSDYGTGSYKPDQPVLQQAAAFRNWLETDPKYKDDFTGINKVRGLPLTDRLRTWERIKTVCKAGLYYTTKELGKNIYFIIDNLNIVDVVNKMNWVNPYFPDRDPLKTINEPTQDFTGDITSAELRFLYRNRNDTAITSNVSFWRDGKQVSAPWIERPKLWEKYENKRQGVQDDTPKQKVRPNQPETKTEEINAIRDRVLNHMANQKWAYAAKEAADLNVTYEETKGLAQGSLIKKAMGLSKLDAIRDEAKHLNLNDQQLEAKIAALAKRAYTAANPTGKKFHLGNLLATTRKVAFYLYRRLPQDEVAKGIIYQKQRGVTGQSKLNLSPTAVFMMGIAGAGKSSILTQIVPNPEDFVHADPDAVKEALPEYREGVAKGNTEIASKVHGESTNINKEIMLRAIRKHRNLIYDTTGTDFGGYKSMLQDLRKNTDYRTKLVMVHLPLATALERVNARGKQTGRYVPQDIIEHQSGIVPKNFKDLHVEADEAYIFSGFSKELKWDKSSRKPIPDVLKEIEMGK